MLSWENKKLKETVLNEALASQLHGRLVSSSDIRKNTPSDFILNFPFDKSTSCNNDQDGHK